MDRVRFSIGSWQRVVFDVACTLSAFRKATVVGLGPGALQLCVTTPWSTLSATALKR